MHASQEYANEESVVNRYMNEATVVWSAVYYTVCQWCRVLWIISVHWAIVVICLPKIPH